MSGTMRALLQEEYGGVDKLKPPSAGSAGSLDGSSLPRNVA